MELFQLEYFLEAARQRNFTRAAARLHLAQAALSEQIRNLEAELGTPLFHRGRRESVLKQLRPARIPFGTVRRRPGSQLRHTVP